MGLPDIRWVSPLKEDDYAEYRDAAWLGRLGLDSLQISLQSFWPKGGPQWDALGMTEDGPVLVEAKTHVGEFLSPPTQASDVSRKVINASFERVRADLGVSNSTEWSEVLYQYANRIAHLWFLRTNGIDANLVFVSFIKDEDMRGPHSADVWHAAFAVADHALGLKKSHRLAKYIHHVYPDVEAL